MRLGKLMRTITQFVCVGEIVTYGDPLPLSLDSKYHMFCFLIIKQSRVCKISVRFNLQKILMLPLTVNRNACNPSIFQLMVYKCGR